VVTHKNIKTIWRQGGKTDTGHRLSNILSGE
jgi:hypothetical protein